MNHPGSVQLTRAASLAASIRSHRPSGSSSHPDLILLLSGYQPQSAQVAGFDRYVVIERPLSFATKLPPRSASLYRNSPWPEDLPTTRHPELLRKLQRRLDGPCTTLKFDAWNFTEYVRRPPVLPPVPLLLPKFISVIMSPSRHDPLCPPRGYNEPPPASFRYHAVLLLDTDVTMREDPSPFIRSFAAAAAEPMIASTREVRSQVEVTETSTWHD